MKILLIEDEEINARLIAGLIDEMDEDIELEGPLASVEEVVDYFGDESNRPDLILADIRLNDGEVFDGFRQVELNIPVIFTTAYDEYAIHAFEFNSIDYLMKPVQKEELAKAIFKYKNMADVLPPSLSCIERIVRQPYLKRILCQSGNATIIVNIDQVAYISMEEGLVKIYLNDGRTHYYIDMSLAELSERLDPQCFFRVNRWEIIQLSEVFSYKTECDRKIYLTLKSYKNLKIAVSRERFPQFKKVLLEY